MNPSYMSVSIDPAKRKYLQAFLAVAKFLVVFDSVDGQEKLVDITSMNLLGWGLTDVKDVDILEEPIHACLILRYDRQWS